MTLINRMVRCVFVGCVLIGPAIIHAAPSLSKGVWTNISPAGSNPSSDHPFWYMAVAPGNPDVMYACQQMGGGGNLWKSTNRGETWKGMNSGSIPDWNAVTTTFIDNPQIPSTAVDPEAPYHLFCNHPGWSGDSRTFGLWESTDGGQNWKRPQGWIDYLATPNSNFDVGRFETDKGDYKHMILSFRYVGGTDGYLESMDGFKTCIFHPKPAFDWGGGTHGIHFLHNDGDPNWTQRSHTWLITAESQGFHRTADGGTTWTVDNSATGRHGGTENAVYAASGNLYCGGTGQLHQSTDNGKTWRGITEGNAYWPNVVSDGTNIYTTHDGGPVYTAPDANATTWTAMPSPPPNATSGGPSTYDPVNGIVYGAFGDIGIWACKVSTGSTQTKNCVTAVAALKLLLVTPKLIQINAGQNEPWKLEMYGLNGIALARTNGIGKTSVQVLNQLSDRGFSVARLTVGSQIITAKLAR
jgi:hypothetical protein